MTRSLYLSTHPFPTRQDTQEILDMIDEVTRDAAWEPNTPPATPKTPVPHSPKPR